jgi:TorA maturation chaperone TorD
MTSTMTSDAKTHTLLAKAAEWRLLGLLFECPVAGWKEQVAPLAAEISDPDLRAAAEAAQEEASEGQYHSIFGPGGPAPAREVSYHDSVQLGYLLSELSAYYEAFSYQPAGREPLDHVAVQLGFVSYLHFKEAYALACADEDHAAITREAIHAFLSGHLANLAEPLAAALRSCGLPYLDLAGKALLRRVGPRSTGKGSQLPVLETPDEEDLFGCGESPALLCEHSDSS